ncbi:MAG: PIG-L family deacetylase [Caldiserica bacterium]|nr:PIG-L family deacetylase [Caldisericota bacterium]
MANDRRVKRKAMIVLLISTSVFLAAGSGAWFGFFGPSVAAPQLAATLSQPGNQLPEIHSTDSVLIVAPHPDDECIATGGAILHAINAGAKVHVVYLTYGDNYEIAYWALKKVPAMTPSEFRALGELRRTEAVKGAASLGLTPDCLTFLGYPDSGTLHIWETTWQPGTSRLHVATNARSVPYFDALSPGSPYNAAAITADLEKVMRAFRPTVVFFPSPLDLNPDHQAAYLLVTAALEDLDLRPSRYTYLVHQRKFPTPLLYNPLSALTPPAFVASLPIQLRNLKLTTDQEALKYATTKLYHSQVDVAYRLLASFSRRNEVFFEDQHMLLSSADAPFFLIPTDFLLERFGHNVELRAVTASRPTPGTLRLTLSFPVAPTEDSVAEVSVFPIMAGTPFAGQPKLIINLQHGKEAAATDLVSGASVTTSVVTTEKGPDVTIDISMPQAAAATQVMLHIRAGYRGLSLYSTPWQVFSLPSS